MFARYMPLCTYYLTPPAPVVFVAFFCIAVTPYTEHIAKQTLVPRAAYYLLPTILSKVRCKLALVRC